MNIIFKIVALICLAEGLLLGFPQPGYSEDSYTIVDIRQFLAERLAVRCENCQKPISGAYIHVSGKSFHPQCFVCAKCGNVIGRAFKQQGDKFYHSECYKELNGYYCDHCGLILGDTWKTYQNKKYHPNCFLNSVQPRCEICKLAISGEYTEDSQGKYHLSCYKLKKLPRCDVCGKPIEGQYIVDSWGNKSHLKHENELSYCESCNRIISKNTSEGGVTYSDGRSMCGICRKSAVFDSHTAEEYLNKAKSLLYEMGFDGFPKEIRINLVDRDKVIKAVGPELGKKTKGFTESRVKTFGPITIASTHKISILFGLPETEFLGVMAHELIHVWLSYHEILLPRDETEGFCNLGSREVYSRDGSPFSKVMLEKMAVDDDPVYGNGYRKMLAKLEEKGWDVLLIDVKNIR